jgi:hypothetical protein
LFSKETLRRMVSDYKMMGQCALQVIYSQDHTMIVDVEHIAIECLRAEKCDSESGDIYAYYYAKDWNDVKMKKEIPQRIPAFGMSQDGMEILYIKPYRAGFYYYSPVDYQGGMQYAELEEEIGNFHLNNIKNGLTPSMLINFNNGVPTEEERNIIEARVSEKFSGSSNAGRFILAFNDSKELAATIEPVQINDAHAQYQFLSDECMTKLMVAHRVTSPMLLGIKDNSGLGNNADELRTASELFENTVLNPIRETILDGISEILAYNDISLNIYFKTLNPIKLNDEVNVITKEEAQKKVDYNLSSQDLDNDIATQLFEKLSEFAEDIDEERWELVDERPVDYENEEALDKMLQLTSTGTAYPNAKSDQDGVTPFGRYYKVRYSYAPNKTSGNSREFCKKMVAANKLYRKEDIVKMESQEVNEGWGPRGADTYNIWLYKGGGACHHYWLRKTFLSKEGAMGVDVQNPNAKATTAAARRAGAKIQSNPLGVSTKPKDMINEGFLKPR